MDERKFVKKKILILFNSISLNKFNSLSGGDRILVELFTRWQDKFADIDVITCKIGKEIFNHSSKKLDNIHFELIDIPKKYYKNIFLLYLYRTIKGFQVLSKIKIGNYDYIYSSSDFWPDVIPALWFKLRNQKVIWLAGFYMFAPNPFNKDTPYRDKDFLRGLFYYLSQLPIYLIIKKFADFVMVTSEPDVAKFITEKRKEDKIIIVQGGVDTKESEKYLRNIKIKIPMEKRKYDGCYLGRLHYQKGVLELIEIWNKVIKKKPNAKLAIIGTGPLEKKIKEKIQNLRLNNNILMFGFKDGEDKYDIFKNSKIILHPATYDSGGMAAAEGMAWGLPGVSFDLPALKTYYPKGMVKTKMFNLEKFAGNILHLITDIGYYNKISTEAISLIRDFWNWDKKADLIYHKIFYE